MAERILVLVGDYVGDYKVMVPPRALQTVGHTVHAIRPDKRAGGSMATIVRDFEDTQAYPEKPGHRFTVNTAFVDVDPAVYNAPVMPGSRAPEYLRLNTHALKVVCHFFQTDKPVVAICHGAQLLSAAGVLEGEVCSAYPTCGPEVTVVDGTFKDISVDQVHTNGKLATAPAWPVHPAWSAQFPEALSMRILH